MDFDKKTREDRMGKEKNFAGAVIWTVLALIALGLLATLMLYLVEITPIVV